MVYTFGLPAGQSALSFRALADRNIVEVFVAGGRGGDTAGVNISNVASPGASVTARLPATVLNASAWECGCGWAQGRV